MKAPGPREESARFANDPKVKQNTQADVEPQPVDTENDPQIPAPFQPESTQAGQLIQAALQKRVAQLETQLQATRRKLQLAQRQRLQALTANKRLVAGLNKYLNEDQVKCLKMATMQGTRWTKKTVIKALKMRLSCGARGYDSVRELGQPLPTERTLHRHLEGYKFTPGLLEDIMESLALKSFSPQTTAPLLTGFSDFTLVSAVPAISRASIITMKNVVIVLAISMLARGSATQNATNTPGSNSFTSSMSNAAFITSGGDNNDYGSMLRAALSRGFDSIPASVKFKLLGADVSTECRLGLLRTLHAFLKLELWALKLLDASGKFPTGVFQGSRAEMGAFDECLDTVVRDHDGNFLTRGQYCNVIAYSNNGTAMRAQLKTLAEVLHPKIIEFEDYVTRDLPLIRLGICFIEDCGKDDLQVLVDSCTSSRNCLF
ncbi:hypothetical protein HPB50_020035 [Hyalomma asiaticum]|uniref:Uncharacterized protein n=1 Tax=Hyalomma asiaticum TaxID=266040 RepID=A0ACB7SFZ1_HYAAI|nr:hypothetical protein HPB50_020035 [Hyalomma asiaticum]